MGEGLDARRQAEHKGNKRVDIEVNIPQLTIAVECEKHGSNKRAEAVKDASSRLAPIPMVDVAVAVVYPKKCNTEDDLTPDTELSYCIVNKTGVAEYAGDHKSYSEDIDWMSCTASKFANVLKHLYRDTGEPDIIANKLKRRLAEAVRNLSTKQCRSLASAINVQHIESTPDTKLYNAAKRALLVVAAAALFHARLAEHLHVMERPSDHDGDWPPPTLDVCNTRQEILAAWKLILKHDYRPIFETGITVLSKSTGTQFSSAIDSVVQWARDTADDVTGLRHDLLGRIFHAVLDSARHDGSMYTTTPAAILLAGLTIRDRNDIPDSLKDMKIMDPACGTGTLLMAAAERVRNIMGEKYDPNTMVENVLCGVDINVTATHMTATTLGMLSPDTKFDKMDVSIVDLGMVNNIASAGSLELYASDGLLPYLEWYGAPGTQVETGETVSHSWKGTADLCIMNPPFTRHDIRHDQLGDDVKRKVVLREAEIFKNTLAKPNKTSSGPMFIILSEYLTKSDGVVSLVLPLVATMNHATSSLRPLLAEKFHIDTIVVPHDPKRFWFSENTSISEMLVIMRRIDKGQPKQNTRIINLAVNPSTSAEAVGLARDIRECKYGDNVQVVEWPHSRIIQGDWAGVQFFSPYLVERFVEIRDGKMFKVVEIGKVADVGPNGRTITMYMNRSDTPGKHGWASIWGNETGRIQSMQIEPYTYVVPKANKKKEADRFWTNRATLLLPERIRLNLVHVTTICSTIPTVGTSWTGVRPHTSDAWSDKRRKLWYGSWPKAMAVYLNSTPGIIALLGVRIPKQLSYPNYSLEENQRRIPVPRLTCQQVSKLAVVYDQLCTAQLGLWRNSSDKTRIALDKAICETLGLDEEVVDRMRHELSREPMVTGRRYGEQPAITDRYE